MELRHLKYFTVLAEELHYGRAAKRLFISQPPLSRQIKILEEELGVQLFIRDNRRVELTQYGEYLLLESEKIIADVEQMKKNLEIMSRGLSGRVSLGYIGSVMHSLLPEILKEIKRDLPDIHFILKELDNEAQREALRRNTIDIGFIRTPINEQELAMETLYSFSLSLVISQNHVLANEKHLRLADFSKEPFIAFPRRCAPALYESVMRIFSTEGIEPVKVHETSQMNSLLRLVESGFGYSIVPGDVKNGYNIGLRFYELNTHNETTDISLIYNKKYSNQMVEKIIQQILNMFKRPDIT